MSGKGKKQASGTKKHVSKSAKAGLQFPVGRLARYARERLMGKRVSVKYAVALAAVVEYINAEVIELSGNAAKDNHAKRITPRHMTLAVRNDEELNQLFSSVTISCGGVRPNIQKVLLPKSRKPSDGTQQPEGDGAKKAGKSVSKSLKSSKGAQKSSDDGAKKTRKSASKRADKSDDGEPAGESGDGARSADADTRRPHAGSVSEVPLGEDASSSATVGM